MQLDLEQLQSKTEEFQSGHKQVLEPGQKVEKYGQGPVKIAPQHAMMNKTRFSL